MCDSKKGRTIRNIYNYANKKKIKNTFGQRDIN